jgi:hypothetical protein
LPALKSPEYRKTGFGIAGIGNTSSNETPNVMKVGVEKYGLI